MPAPCTSASATESPTSEIRRAAQDGVREMHVLTMRTGVGSGCGSCMDLAAQILEETAAAQALRRCRSCKPPDPIPTSLPLRASLVSASLATLR